jgi:DNA (cytosine-5)-methyltransferase 1
MSTITATYYKGIQADGRPAIAVLAPDRVVKRQNGRMFKTDGEPMFTLTTQDRHGVFNGIRIRKLTPCECERLMSWEDSWTKFGDFDGVIKEISDSQRYKMCGNGVVSEVVYQLVKNLVND